MNLVDLPTSLLRCRHASSPLSFGYRCVPLSAQGEYLVILHLQKVSPNEEGQMYSASRLASTVAEGMAMALANMKLREILRDQAIRDPLTGLFNRRYMIETFERKLTRAQRNGDSLSVIMMDLDNFKNFNDIFGHDMGDRLLSTFGHFIKGNIRKEDVIFRWGGRICLNFAWSIPKRRPWAGRRNKNWGKATTGTHGDGSPASNSFIGNRGISGERIYCR